MGSSPVPQRGQLRAGVVGRGVRRWGDSIDYPFTPVSMARRRSKMFKQISNVHVENVSDADWSSFLTLEKQDPSMTSAYIDKVRISWVCTSASNHDRNGLLFVASHDIALNSTTASANDGNIIAATASRGGGGVVTLDIKRRITLADVSDTEIRALLEGSTGAPVWLHVHKSNTSGAQNFLFVIETYGRWFKATSQ